MALNPWKVSLEPPYSPQPARLHLPVCICSWHPVRKPSAPDFCFLLNSNGLSCSFWPSAVCPEKSEFLLIYQCECPDDYCVHQSVSHKYFSQPLSVMNV
ncbi:hypothetical protein ILYODFUR_014104 [Ilyodon furcidens]|uniref:Uncharacterized protein n=1 Tax=Ilyodon furcidens TaxID=33524 RepID=A0ABV0URV3_9TELE